MSPLKRIIVGHDLRTGGERALRSAAVFAKWCGAALRLVHVIEPRHSYQRVSHPLTAPLTTEEIAQRTGAALQTLAASPELQQFQVEYEVRQGKPFVELIIARRAWQADLIIVGSAEEREAHFLGSTSERVLRKAMVPVLVAKETLDAEPNVLLVPTDFSDCAKRAAIEALELAESFSSRVVFLHVIDLYPFYSFSYLEETETFMPLKPPSAGELESEWQVFLSGLNLANVDWEKIDEEGQPALTIARRAEQRRADLIVMGTHGRSGLEYMLLGSVTEKVARKARCSVLTIRPEAFQFKLP
jgi:nucleotide-binding universal stress UspA family protein